ncbi:hypothetical protein [Asaia platycodi]|uniref:hypothetical protein n=1 Tax=Asaia platycodi TaxID=610243 RepID=UPI000AA5A559|nr:hypothetical protein [Asaia platycodi]
MALKTRLASIVSRDARLKQAIDQIESGENLVQGFTALGQLAQQGNVEAQYRTGKAYLEVGGRRQASRTERAGYARRQKLAMFRRE